MGLQDRNYYDDDNGKDPWSSDPDAWKGGSGGGGKRRNIITILIIINVAIFLLDAFTPIPTEEQKVYEQEVQNTPAEMQNQVAKPPHWLSGTMALTPDVFQKPWKIWKIMSYGFAHASIDSKSTFFHVGSNMLVLFFLGRPVEQKYGRDEFLRFYLLAIVVSGIGWLVAQGIAGIENSSAVGASGAVSAVLALFIFNFPKEKVLLWGVLAMPAWLLGVLVVGSDLLRAFDPANRIAWEAHLAGFAFGAAYFQLKWNFRWIKLDAIGKTFRSKPNLKVHNPDVDDDALQQQADAVLDKIAKQGESSLTAKERRILNRYSKNLRKKRD